MTARSAPLDPLFAAVAAGDEGAVGPFVRALRPILVAFCTARLGEGAGEDAAQEALCTLLARAPSYDRDRPVLPWALTVAAYACQTAQTRTRRRGEAPLEEAGDTATPPLEAQLEAREALARAAEALSALDTGPRAAIEAALLGGDGVPLSPGARKARERAFTGLRALFRRLYDG